MLQLGRFLLHAAHALLHRRRPAGTAPPGEGDPGLAVPAFGSSRRFPPGPAALHGGGGQRQPPPAAAAHLSASGHFSPRQARLPAAASRVIVSVAGGETQGCSRRAAARLAEAAAAPPGCHTAGSELPPREGAGSSPGAAAAAALLAGLGPEGSAPRPWLLPAGAKSRVLPPARGCSEERGAREKPIPLRGRRCDRCPLRWCGMRLAGDQWRCGAGQVVGRPVIDPGIHPPKLLRRFYCPRFRLSATRGLFSNPGPLLTSTLLSPGDRGCRILEGRGTSCLGNGK